MKELDKHQVGMIVGSFVGLLHLLWAIAVALGFGQTILDFVYAMHFLDNPFIVQKFDITLAIILVVVTFVCGYIAGFVFTAIWNKLVTGKK